MRILFLAIACLFLLLMMTGSALACDCVTLSPKESFENADVIFEGELVRVGRTTEVWFATTYTFSVNKMLKGPRTKEVVIFGGATDCDATFFPDVIYRVYASESQGKLISGACSGKEVLTKRQRISYGGEESISVWQLWYMKVLTIAVLALFLILIVHQKSWKRSKILKNQP